MLILQLINIWRHKIIKGIFLLLVMLWQRWVDVGWRFHLLLPIVLKQIQVVIFDLAVSLCAGYEWGQQVTRLLEIRKHRHSDFVSDSESVERWGQIFELGVDWCVGIPILFRVWIAPHQQLIETYDCVWLSKLQTWEHLFLIFHNIILWIIFPTKLTVQSKNSTQNKKSASSRKQGAESDTSCRIMRSCLTMSSLMARRKRKYWDANASGKSYP